jgi:CheY-like chemotaxis protein
MKRKEPKYKYTQVMLVDDNELDNFINKKIIESTHFSKHIYINSSGKSALEFLRNITELSEIYDEIYPKIIFIDINMPMLDGFQFIDLLETTSNKNIEKCKLVVLTSSIHPNDKNRATELSKNIVFLNKPLTESMLKDL